MNKKLSQKYTDELNEMIQRVRGELGYNKEVKTMNRLPSVGGGGWDPKSDF